MPMEKGECCEKSFKTLEHRVNPFSAGWCCCKNVSGFAAGLEIPPHVGYFGQALSFCLPFFLILETQNGLDLKRP